MIIILRELDALHSIHEGVVAVVSQEVRVPTIGWGGVVDACVISKDSKGPGGQGLRGIIKAVKAEP